MDKILGFVVIGLCYLFGSFLTERLSLPIPGSIIGMLSMLLLLSSGVIKARMVKQGCIFLIGVMPLFFVPASMGLINHFNTLQHHFMSLIGSTVFSTLAVMAIIAVFIDKLVQSKSSEKK
ncbi:CidA/LrgA family protein [Veronia nyctiphanis]|nr:CidA/LrgA family protein [Veronia nyctiphanis]